MTISKTNSTKRTPKSQPVYQPEPTSAPTYNYPPPNNNNMFFIIIIILLVIFSAYMFKKMETLETTLKNNPTGGTQQQAAPAVKVKLDDIKKLFSNGYMKFGDANKKVLFVEISDPSCPYCHIADGKDAELAKQVNPPQFVYNTDGGSYIPPLTEMRKLVDEGKAGYVMLYSNGHGSGELASQALYCAYDKNKFWEAHDLLLSNAGYELLNTTLERDSNGTPLNSDKNMGLIADFLTPALDSNIVKDCLTNKKYASQITRDQQVAASLGYNGTPHFFVNTTAYPGAVPFSSMQAAVDEALK